MSLLLSEKKIKLITKIFKKSAMNSKNFFVEFLIKLSKFIPKYIPLPIIRGPLRGFKWITSAAAGEAKGLSILVNFVEPKQIAIAKKLMREDFICFDIGANVGLYSLLFSRYAKSVYAFESLLRNVQYLAKTLAYNSVKNVKIIPYAVSNTNKPSFFKEGLDHSRGKLDNNGNIPILTISLDMFVSKTKINPNLIKIDVEGAELCVLKGAKNLLSNEKPIILLSTHGYQTKIDCLRYLKKLNYQEIKILNASSIEKASEFVIKP